MARLRALAVESGLDPVFSEKFLRFIVAEVIHHHQQHAEATGEPIESSRRMTRALRHRRDRRRAGRCGRRHPCRPRRRAVVVFDKGRARPRQGVRRRPDAACGRGAGGAEDPARRRPPHRRPADDRRQAGTRAAVASPERTTERFPDARRGVAAAPARRGADRRRRRRGRRGALRDRGRAADRPTADGACHGRRRPASGDGRCRSRRRSPPARRARWPACSAPSAIPTSRSAWRSAPTPRPPATPTAHLEACLTLRDEHGTPVPGYGWMFPAGDGTVNIGVGALSTMKGFKKLNLNTLLDSYRRSCTTTWDLGPNLERPRAWRLPMSAARRHGPGWVAIGDAAGLINPMNGEGIDYGLESGMLAADLFLDDPAPAPRRVRPAGRRTLRRVPAHRPAVRVPDRPPVAPAPRPAVLGEHRRHRQHHAARDGQPRRLVDARCGRPHDAESPTRRWRSPTRCCEEPAPGAEPRPAQRLDAQGAARRGAGADRRRQLHHRPSLHRRRAGRRARHRALRRPGRRRAGGASRATC